MNKQFNWDSPTDLEFFGQAAAPQIVEDFIPDDKENKSTYIKTDVEGTLITITCYNFNNSLGSGTVYPQNLATIGGKKLYFHFIVYKISQESSRHIIYTFYEDIK